MHASQQVKQGQLPLGPGAEGLSAAEVGRPLLHEQQQPEVKVWLQLLQVATGLLVLLLAEGCRAGEE